MRQLISDQLGINLNQFKVGPVFIRNNAHVIVKFSSGRNRKLFLENEEIIAKCGKFARITELDRWKMSQ